MCNVSKTLTEVNAYLKRTAALLINTKKATSEAVTEKPSMRAKMHVPRIGEEKLRSFFMALGAGAIRATLKPNQPLLCLCLSVF